MPDETLQSYLADPPSPRQAGIRGLSGVGRQHASAAGAEEITGGAFTIPRAGKAGTEREANWAPIDTYRVGQVVILSSSHTILQSYDDVEGWTRSEAFRAAHRVAGDHTPVFLDPPRVEAFDVIQTVSPA